MIKMLGHSAQLANALAPAASREDDEYSLTTSDEGDNWYVRSSMK